MKQRLLILFCCVFFFTSCDFFQKKEFVNTIAIDTVIDFNSVDVFPLFPTCDSIPSQEKQKICSQIKLSEQIYASLSTQEIISTDKLNDTILIKLNIDNSGKVSLSSLIANDHINQQIPNLDSLIESGIEKLPLLKPAIKRGMPVTTEFTLPIIVKN
jgi:hypothetical protein